MVKLTDLITEGVSAAYVLTKDATIRYNVHRDPKTMIPGALYTASPGYVKMPKGTFLVQLPGGLFAVNVMKKWAKQITSHHRSPLGAQDKLKHSDYDVLNPEQGPVYAYWKNWLK